MPTPISLSEAKEAGLKFYFTGKPCKHGHTVERYVSSRICRACMNQRSRAWYEDNQERVKETGRAYYVANKERKLERGAEYSREKYRTDPNYKLSKIMRMNLRRTLNGEAKDDTSVELLGYTQEELRLHLEAQFTEDMSWDNHGELWHIDHIVPVKHYLDVGEKNHSVVHALENLRPLLATDNMSKGATYDPNTQRTVDDVVNNEQEDESEPDSNEEEEEEA